MFGDERKKKIITIIIDFYRDADLIMQIASFPWLRGLRILYPSHSPEWQPVIPADTSSRVSPSLFSPSPLSSSSSGPVNKKK